MSEITYREVASAQAQTDKALARLARRAAKKGLPVPSWTWGETRTAVEEHHERHPEYRDVTIEVKRLVTRVELFISAEPVRYAGWTFLASVEHMTGEDGQRVDWVSALPGASVPSSHKNRGPVCDHCGHRRARSRTYVLVHEDGRHTTVGSTCVDDFLGGTGALDLAAQAEILASLHAAGEAGEGYSSGGGEVCIALPTFLAAVACFVRTDGWVSRWRDAGHGPERNDDATADRVLRALDRKEEIGATEEDHALAADAIEWASELAPAEGEDYLDNCKQVASLGFVNGKIAGVAASLVPAYQREIGRRRLAAERAARPTANEYLGTPGEKVTFGLAPKVGKKGQPLKGAPTVLSAEPLLLDFVTGYETDFGYTTVLKFRSAEGHVVVWKASNTSVGRDDVGKRYAMAASVKAHTEYKDERQTVVTRATVTEVSDLPA